MKILKKNTSKNIIFKNYILYKQNFFFKNLFNDFCFFFNKIFKKLFFFPINIQFLKSIYKYNFNLNYLLYSKYRSRYFFLNNIKNKCILLITNDFFSIFINSIFGNVHFKKYKNYNNKKLTFNEKYILELIFKKIFIILNYTFLKNIIDINNTYKYKKLDNLFKKSVSKKKYICFVFRISLNKTYNKLKIYIPSFLINTIKENDK
ncbi:hypothetical protein [Buchnera aphidicola]|uniref:hypothetical protein n=1 Tax=Buchnera aphidicola TaxID=9 RepID=UPI00030B03CB|nr:hypothetical protein [Buchnera aphidicola]